MTGFRFRQLLGAAAFGAMILPAAGQWTSDKPPVLQPEDYPPETTQDPPDKPAASGPEKRQPGDIPDAATGAPQPLGRPEVQVLPAPGSAVQPAPEPVDVSTLGTPEGPPVGTLDVATGGLGDHSWSGSERSNVEDLLVRAPLLSGDPVLRDLTRRVVLTKAGAPPGSAKRAFVTVRIVRLLDAGLIEAAGAIAAQAAVPNDEDFTREQARAILTASRAKDACGPATATRLTSGETFWMQLRAYCAAAGGDTATAELTNQVLKAQGQDDPAYDALVEAIVNKKPVAAPVIGKPNALHVFLLQQAGLPISEAVARKMGTPENLLVARDTRSSPRDRFEAAERIVATGALDGGELVKIADAQDLPLARVANAGADAPGLPFFMGQVLLRRAAIIEPRPEEKARLAALALSLGEKFNLAPLAAALQADVIASLKPSASLHQYARSFARAAVLAGKSDIAARWTNGDAVMKVVVAFASQDPARMAAVQADLTAFAEGLTKNPPEPDADRSYKGLVLGLGDVLAVTMPPSAKAAAASLESQMWDGKRPGPGQLRTINEIALSPERRGEALLMMLASIQTIGLCDLAPDVTIEYVRMLAGMNEAAAARALAIDALAQFVPPKQTPASSPAVVQ